MAYDEQLVSRIRARLGKRVEHDERKMFGGIAFLWRGYMFAGVASRDMMLRVGPKKHADVLKKPHVRPMDFTGKPMKGYVFVAPEGLASDRALDAFLKLGLDFVATLPDKT